jgi:DNA-binding winged helix-turn-helix (wHTH) protein
MRISECLRCYTGAVTGWGALVPVNGNSTIRFSVFELDLKAGELRRNGSKIRLQEQPFQILVSLLEHPGEVVTREELRSKLWPADTFVDFDHSLNAAIRRLRDALGDSADRPRFVETVARRGYRFIAPVTHPTRGRIDSGSSTFRPRIGSACCSRNCPTRGHFRTSQAQVAVWHRYRRSTDRGDSGRSAFRASLGCAARRIAASPHRKST